VTSIQNHHVRLQRADRPRRVLERGLGYEHIELRQEAQEEITLGAQLVERKSSRIGDLEERCFVMRDPEGNGFCVQ
jgi:Glyoxalase-like domain